MRVTHRSRVSGTHGRHQMRNSVTFKQGMAAATKGQTSWVCKWARPQTQGTGHAGQSARVQDFTWTFKNKKMSPSVPERFPLGCAIRASVLRPCKWLHRSRFSLIIKFCFLTLEAQKGYTWAQQSIYFFFGLCCWFPTSPDSLHLCPQRRVPCTCTCQQCLLPAHFPDSGKETRAHPAGDKGLRCQSRNCSPLRPQ